MAAEESPETPIGDTRSGAINSGMEGLQCPSCDAATGRVTGGRMIERGLHSVRHRCTSCGHRWSKFHGSQVAK